jgi:CarD family transcriptional regulator
MATKTKAKVKSKTLVKSTKVKAKTKPAAKAKPVAAKAKKTVAVKKAAPSKKPAAKAVAKKMVAKKATAKAMPKKPVAKKAVSSKPAVKAVAKPTMKMVEKMVAKPVDSRKTLDRAPAPANKAPIATVGSRPQRPAYVVPASQQPQNPKKNNFAVGEYVVYPTHGVGKIMGHESEKIGDYELKVFVIAFEKDKMTLRVPTGRAEAAGLRSISPNDQISRAISTLKGRAKIARGMWSRRAQEYEAKINSGNLIAIAEVVRDLHKNVDQSERSYSERMIYETAMHRLCGEVAASEKVDIKLAQDRLLKVLRKQAAEAAAA